MPLTARRNGNERLFWLVLGVFIGTALAMHRTAESCADSGYSQLFLSDETQLKCEVVPRNVPIP